jgi:hypothetical protein
VSNPDSRFHHSLPPLAIVAVTPIFLSF